VCVGRRHVLEDETSKTTEKGLGRRVPGEGIAGGLIR
jgi:hypothetical protein